LVGVTAVVYRAYSGLAVERLGAAVLIGAVLTFGADLQGVVMLVLIDLVLLGVILLETRRLPDRAD
ncbi:MAG: hypothetical protein ACN4GZ_13405, partial [Acidimicrobiales bacterium]